MNLKSNWKNLLGLLLLLGMSTSAHANKFCSTSDFQSCKTCEEISKAIDIETPDAGEYFRGAEWNELFASYKNNCPLIAAKLLRAGANPSKGGLYGSMILTLSGKWPHKNKSINEAWAALLLVAGASKTEGLGGNENKNTLQILKEETYLEIEYPEILNLF